MRGRRHGRSMRALRCSEGATLLRLWSHCTRLPSSPTAVTCERHALTSEGTELCLAPCLWLG